LYGTQFASRRHRILDGISRVETLIGSGVEISRIIGITLSNFISWSAVVLDKTILLSVFAPFLKQMRTDKMQFVADLGMPDRIRCVAYYKNKLVLTSESQIIVTDLKGNTIRAFKVENPRYIFVDTASCLYASASKMAQILIAKWFYPERLHSMVFERPETCNLFCL
jgi:hypothetical protein